MTAARGVSRRVFAGLFVSGLLGATGCAAIPPAGHPAPPRPPRLPSGPGHDLTVPLTATAPSPPSAAPPADAAGPPAEVQAVVDRYHSAHPTAWGMQLPGIRNSLHTTNGRRDGAPHLALTFDACGGPDGSGFDEKLIGALIARRVPATLFLNSRWIEANPDLSDRLFAEPLFEIGNHGTRHRPLSVRGRAAYGIPGTASAAEAVDEVWRNHELIRVRTGRAPRWFRAGTAHYDDVAVSLVHDLGETPLGFSINGDGGATYPAHTVTREVLKAEAGGVVLAHMNQPGSGTADGMIAAISALRDRGVRFVHVD
ncbi:MAG: polysaccharide deacetylase family protein [Actinobacteria bacterium]|nr:polysaccharide deacetylase family protein [Actinomycetota bacterium]